MISLNLCLYLSIFIPFLLLTLRLFHRYRVTKEILTLLLACFFLCLSLASLFGFLSSFIILQSGYENVLQWEINVYPTLSFPESWLLIQIVEIRGMLVFQCLAYYVFYLFRLQSFSTKWHIGKYTIFMTLETLFVLYIGFINFVPFGDATDAISALFVLILAILIFPQFTIHLIQDRRKIKDETLKQSFTPLIVFGLMILLGQGLLFLDVAFLFVLGFQNSLLFCVSWGISVSTIVFAYLGYYQPAKKNSTL